MDHCPLYLIGALAPGMALPRSLSEFVNMYVDGQEWSAGALLGHRLQERTVVASFLNDLFSQEMRSQESITYTD